MTPEQIAQRILTPGWWEAQRNIHLDRIVRMIDDEETRREISAETLLAHVVHQRQISHTPRSRW